jgi:dTDP-4-amino-4,6-dideoxygalactose transaminase
MGEIEGALARVQLRKTQMILNALRDRKRQLLDLLGGPPSGTALRPVRAEAEEASIALILLLDENMPGLRMSEALKAEGVEAALLLAPGCPLPDRHFCQGWGNVLGQERLAGEHSCSRTKSLLERCLELQIDPRWSPEDLVQIAEGLHKVFYHFLR